VDAEQISVGNGGIWTTIQSCASGDENRAIDEEGECEEADREFDDGHFHAVVDGRQRRKVGFFIGGGSVDAGCAVGW